MHPKCAYSIEYIDISANKYSSELQERIFEFIFPLMLWLCCNAVSSFTTRLMHLELYYSYSVQKKIESNVL